LGRQYLSALFVSAAVASTAEGYAFALAIALLSAALIVVPFGRSRMILAVGSAIASVWLGSIWLAVLALAALSTTLSIAAASRIAVGLLFVHEFAPRIGLLADDVGPSIVTAASLFGPSAFILALWPHSTRTKSFVATLCPLLMGAALAGMLSANWMSVDYITHPLVRLITVIALFVPWIDKTMQTDPSAESPAPPKLGFGGGILAMVGGGIFIGLSIATYESPIASVVFDEAHGDWASTSAEYKDESFGRVSTYSYSVLASIVSRNGYEVRRNKEADHFPALEKDAAFVLKMPTRPLSGDFSDGLVDWVRKGGRLIVIADHTDLFDTAHNLNAVLVPMGAKLAAAAVFDRLGQPPVEIRNVAGRWLSSSVPRTHRYLTGTALSELPFSAMSLRGYGMSFAEDAVYFRPNRFGYFQPRADQAYASHIAVASWSFGRGTVLIWTDSTHWSTFSVYVAAYQDSFLEALSSLRRVAAISVYPIALTALAVLLGCTAFFHRVNRHRTVLIGGALAVVLGLNAGLRATASPALEDTSTIAATLGSDSTNELLAVLVTSPERNYARALTALQKWAPLRLHESNKGVLHSKAGTKLFIGTTADDLPDPRWVLEAVASGERIVVMSPTGAMSSLAGRQWLASLGLRIRNERTYARAAEAGNGIEGRRAPIDLRLVNARVLRAPDSVWLETQSAHLYQRFVLREMKGGRSSMGELIISTQSEQWSDAAMGEVWDGVLVEDLARDRERSLAELIGRPTPAVTSIDPGSTPSEAGVTPTLKHFLVVKAGKVIAEGVLPLATEWGPVVSMTETPEAFVGQLYVDVRRFVDNCKVRRGDAFCPRTFIDRSLTEWFVLVRENQGRITSIELVHEARLSGLREAINILFD
jgi:hypothetical protein